MFSNEELQSYRDIKAPEELYEKVIQSSSSHKRRLHGLTYAAVTIAACFVIVFTRTPNDISVNVNGQELHKTIQFYDISPASDMRTSPVFSIPMEIDAEHETKISVSHGVLILPDGNAVMELTTDGNTTFCWEFPRGDELPLCRLKMQSGRKTSYIDLTYDNDTNIIIATKNKQ